MATPKNGTIIYGVKENDWITSDVLFWDGRYIPFSAGSVHPESAARTLGLGIGRVESYWPFTDEEVRTLIPAEYRAEEEN